MAVAAVALLAIPSLATPLETSKPSPEAFDCEAYGLETSNAATSFLNIIDSDDAPTPAPSINHACSSETSNARGYYTSTVAPCSFHFHKVDESKDEMDMIQYHTSDLCEESNSFLSIKEYVTDFPDECVGDFQRCYSLEHHHSLLVQFFCQKMNFPVPEGTTHISIDCTVDKDIVLQSASSSRREMEYTMKKEEHHDMMQGMKLKMMNWSFAFGFCLACVYAISQLIIKPMVQQQRRWRNENDLVGTPIAPGHHSLHPLPHFHAHPSATAYSAEVTTETIPTGRCQCSGSTTNNTTCNSHDCNTGLDTTETTILSVVATATDSTSLDDVPTGTIIPMPEVDVDPNDFELQIPADFDAVPIPADFDSVPIVSATIIYE